MYTGIAMVTQDIFATALQIYVLAHRHNDRLNKCI